MPFSLHPSLFPAMFVAAILGGILWVAFQVLADMNQRLRSAQQWDANAVIVLAEVISAEYHPPRRKRVGSSGNYFDVRYAFVDGRGLRHYGSGELGADDYRQAVSMAPDAAIASREVAARVDAKGEPIRIRVQAMKDDPSVHRVEALWIVPDLRYDMRRFAAMVAFFLAVPAWLFFKLCVPQWYCFGTRPVQAQVHDVMIDAASGKYSRDRWVLSLRYRDEQGRGWRTLGALEKRATWKMRVLGLFFGSQGRILERRISEGDTVKIWVNQSHPAIHYFNRQALLAAPDG